MTELKPCPSCGSPLIIKTYIPAGKVYVCERCGWKKRKYEHDEEVKE